MPPLFDGHGDTVAFLGSNGRIIGLGGESLAWINQSGNVYDYSGRHLGWWNGGHMRGHDGGVIAWTHGAQGTGVLLPLASLPPLAPLASLEPLRPLPSLPPLRPLNSMSWSSTRLL